MPVSNACFISYMHSPDPGVQQTIKAFRDALAAQVGLYIPKAPVYIDDRLRGGDLFELELAAQMCGSGCMVLLFNPFYFDTENPYCAREYQAMLALESRRLNGQANELRTRGLIIPVVVRGEDALPEEIKNQRHYFSLDRLLLQPADFAKPECVQLMREIAEVIYRRYRAVRALQLEPCQQFRFPPVEKILPWLKDIVDGVPAPKLPGS